MFLTAEFETASDIASTVLNFCVPLQGSSNLIFSLQIFYYYLILKQISFSQDSSLCSFKQYQQLILEFLSLLEFVFKSCSS